MWLKNGAGSLSRAAFLLSLRSSREREAAALCCGGSVYGFSDRQAHFSFFLLGRESPYMTSISLCLAPAMALEIYSAMATHSPLGSGGLLQFV
jgi:hypothetical protein